MARVDQYQNRQSIDIGSSFNAPDRVRPTTLAPIEVPFRPTPNYTGQAVEAFGAGLSSFSAQVGDLAQRRQVTADNSWFSKARAGFVRGWMEKEGGLQTSYGDNAVGPSPSSPAGGARAAAGTAPGYSGQGFAEFAYSQYEKDVETVLKGAPSETARQQFRQWADGYGTQVAERSLAWEEQQLFAQRASDLNEAFTQHLQVVAADPDQFDVVWQRAQEDLINARSWMTPAQIEKAAADLRNSLELARAKRIVQTDPLRWFEETGMASGPIATTAAKIIGVESRGNATAKNPRSSASGLGQFTDATWLATIHKHRPDLAGRMSDAELLQLKTDPDLARAMTIAHTQDNADGLALSGIETTEGNLYLAHFAGIEGARAVLGADPNTPIVDILGADVVRANPFLQGKSAGWLIGWAYKAMGDAAPADMGSFVDDPYYSTMSPDQIFALTKDANSVLVAQHNSAVKAQESINAARLNALSLAILDGTAGMADIGQARRDGWLWKFEDVKRLTDLVQTRDKDQITTAQALARMGDPNASFNPFVDDDRKVVNTAYGAMGGAIGLTSGDETSVLRLTSFVDRTDIIPSDAVAALRAGMQSRDPAQMQASFAVMDQLYRAFPAAMSAPGAFGEEDLKRSLRWRNLMEAGVPVETVVGAMNEANLDPAKVKMREEWRQEGRKLAMETDPTEVLAIFNPAGWWGNTGAPIDSSITQSLMDDYATAFAEGFSINRDPEQAKQYAIEVLTNPAARAWGLTDTGNSASRVMKYPPEYYFQPVAGDHDWMGEQLEGVIEAQTGTRTLTKPGPNGPEMVTTFGPKAQDWGVTATPATEGAIGMGQIPKWMVHYIDENGMFRTIMPPADAKPGWPFDYSAALSADRTQRASDRPALVEGLNRVDQINEMDRTEAQREWQRANEQRAYEERMNQ